MNSKNIVTLMGVDSDDVTEDRTLLVQIKSENGESLGNQISIGLNTTSQNLQGICNILLNNEERSSFAFFINDKEILTSVGSIIQSEKLNTESVIDIIYQEQAVFQVRPVTRCTSSLPGHAEAVLFTQFSPDSQRLASGSGDTTVRFWDIQTQTPHHTCSGHKDWVMCLAWSPDSKRVISGCKKGEILAWDPVNGKMISRMRGHKQWITALVWEPYIRNKGCNRFASSSKDGNIKIWDVILGNCLLSLTSHIQSVTCLKWGGTGLLYSGSQDRTVKVWRAEDGVLCRTLTGHGHWINTMALNTDYVMRTATVAFDVKHRDISDDLQLAETKYKEIVEKTQGEILITGSDDFTLFMWHPENSNKPIGRMTGHQQPINCVQFSPDARLIASASFDKSIKLWDGRTGKFITTLRGHVNKVYVISWSIDSRLIVSGSSDSTLKVWDVKTQSLKQDLPGHADEVYDVDWSPDGQKVVSGGKDKLLRIWQN